VAITPDGRHVYVATENEAGLPEGQGKVSVIDTAKGAVVAKIVGSPFPAAAAETPDGRSVWVLDTEGPPALIDTSTHQRTFPPGFDLGGRGSPSRRTVASRMRCATRTPRYS
jgi:DNA-binding beta-propeller fold protein YncE